MASILLACGSATLLAAFLFLALPAWDKYKLGH